MQDALNLNVEDEADRILHELLREKRKTEATQGLESARSAISQSHDSAKGKRVTFKDTTPLQDTLGGQTMPTTTAKKGD